MFYELASLIDYVYKFDADWLSSVSGTRICKKCGNILQEYRNETMDIRLRTGEELGPSVLSLNYKASINIIKIDLFEHLSSFAKSLTKGRVLIGDEPADEYCSVVIPDQYRFRKYDNKKSFRYCECGRQLGGGTDWKFEPFEIEPPDIISTDYGYGIFVSEIVLSEMNPVLLDHIALHPRSVAEQY